MKKLTFILLILAAIIITSCEGPMGTPGIPGEDGESFIGSVIETDFVTFNEGNEYSYTYYFEEDFLIYDTDVVLVYILWDQVDGLDVWRLLPQTVVLPEGVIQYNFDYTVADVQVFMEGTIPPQDWLPAETDNQIFRIAVLPAGFAAKKSVDISDINSIMNSPELNLSTIKDVEFTNLDSTPKIQIEK